VIVDLSELMFGDSSLMFDLACLARRLRVDGGTLRLRNPRPTVRTVIEQMGLHRLPGVLLEASAPALAF
jgi:anti-anti-sigma regulatory factor